MELLIVGFLLGILASAIAAIVLEYGVRPLLGIVVEDSGRAQGQVPEHPRHEFYHVKVRNLPARWPLPGRRPAWSCKCNLEVFGADAQPCFPGPLLARWTSHPEPVFPIADQGRVVHIPDFAKMIAGRKVDVHNHDDQQLSVALKFEGEAAIHLFTNESYLFPRWQNPAWRLEIGTYRLRVTAYYERGRAVGDFELANLGTSLDGVRIRPWTGRNAIA